MARHLQQGLEIDAPDDRLVLATRVARDHAQKNLTGLRGWEASQLTWEVEEQFRDDRLACSVVLIAARPLSEPASLRVIWEYWLDDGGKIIPGFPIAQEMPDIGRPIPSVRYRGISERGPSRWDSITLKIAVVLAVVIAMGSFVWMAFGPSRSNTKDLGSTSTPAPIRVRLANTSPFALKVVILPSGQGSVPAPVIVPRQLRLKRLSTLQLGIGSQRDRTERNVDD